MRLIEIVCSAGLLALSLGIFSSSLGPLKKFSAGYYALKNEYQTDRFIAESFKALCSRKDSTKNDFDEWEKMCSLTFSLSSISVEKNAGAQELKCSWEKENRRKEMVCVKEK